MIYLLIAVLIVLLIYVLRPETSTIHNRNGSVTLSGKEFSEQREQIDELVLKVSCFEKALAIKDAQMTDQYQAYAKVEKRDPEAEKMKQIQIDTAYAECDKLRRLLCRIVKTGIMIEGVEISVSGSTMEDAQMRAVTLEAALRSKGIL